MDIRLISVEELRARADRASGMAHSYSVDIGKTRATVTYSNPDEYGSARPYSVRFPLVPNDLSGPMVALTVASEYGPGLDEHDKESAWQTLDADIVSGPDLLNRNGEWETRWDWISANRPELARAMPRGFFRSDGYYVRDGRGAALATIDAGLPVEIAEALARDMAAALNRAAERDGRPSAAEEEARARFEEERRAAEARRAARAAGKDA